MLSQYADMIRQSVAADNPDDDDDDDLHDDEATDLAYSIKDIAQLIGSPSDDSEEETEPAAAVRQEARTEFYIQVLVRVIKWRRSRVVTAAWQPGNFTNISYNLLLFRLENGCDVIFGAINAHTSRFDIFFAKFRFK